MHGTLSAMHDRNADLSTALDSVRHGVLVLSSDGLILEFNSAAAELLRSSDGIGCREGRLTMASGPAERSLHRALQSACASADAAAGTTFGCERPSARRPLVVRVIPLRQGPRGASALVSITDPECVETPHRDALRQLFGLTAAEADVAARVAGGHDLTRISTDLSVSLTTVRTHLAHVFDKTGTHRQAELVALVSALTR